MQTEIPERIAALLADVGEIPALPDIPLQVLRMAGDDEIPLKDFSRLIERDPALTTNILRTANSAYYGVRQRVSTLSMAISLLGLNEIVNLVCSVSVMSMFGREGGAHQLNGPLFWRHSLGCAVASQMLSNRFHFNAYGAEFVAGLIHDIGVLVSAQYLPGHYGQILDVMDHTGGTMTAAEVEVLGITHADIGAWVAERWRLPPLLVEAIRFHHAPLDALAQARSSEQPGLAAVVHLADRVAAEGELRFVESAEGEPPLEDDVAWSIILAERLEIDRRHVAEYAREFAGQRARVDQLIGAMA